MSEWLVKEQLVADGRLSPKAAGLELASLVPPDMQMRAQVLIDQLPRLPQMLVRFAGVLGHCFDADDLMSMMPEVCKDDPEMLMENLLILQEVDLVEPVLDRQNSEATQGMKWKVLSIPGCLSDLPHPLKHLKMQSPPYVSVSLCASLSLSLCLSDSDSVSSLSVSVSDSVSVSLCLCLCLSLH